MKNREEWMRSIEEEAKRAEAKGMCLYCDYESSMNMIYQEGLTGEWYLDIETGEWDEWDDDYVHIKEHVRYCPYCGRKLDGAGIDND